MTKVVLLRYCEIHLKGQNRPYFERLLVSAVKGALKKFPNAKVERAEGRYFVKGLSDDEFPAAMSALEKVFGVHSLSPAVELEKKEDVIAAAAIDEVNAYLKKYNKAHATFKVECKRADKRFPYNSMQFAAKLGGDILDAFDNVSVDVHHPDFKVYVEIRENAYVYADIIPGQGGMPLGSNGKAHLLLSGGIDSPVAGYMVAKRGVRIEAVHYESFPYTSERAKEKVISLARILTQYTGPIKLHIVNFTDIQMAIYEKCPEEMLTVIMRRFMMRIAERIALQNGGQALITGESIGQVASQTIESLNVTNSSVDMPVFRPLIGMDKIEIMDRAEKLGTYETSILPYEDCCTVFVPKHPTTRPKLAAIEEAETVLPVEEMIADALNKTEVIIVRQDD